MDEAEKPCFWGNYAPDWHDESRCHYHAKGQYPENLWRRHKLTHDQYEEYVILCRDNVTKRLQELQLVRAQEEAQENSAEREQVSKRFKADPGKFKPFKVFPILEQWKATMAEDRMRYPILVIVAHLLPKVGAVYRTSHNFLPPYTQGKHLGEGGPEAGLENIQAKRICPSSALTNAPRWLSRTWARQS